MSHIHFIGGEKGGVGKSVVARVLTQRLLDLNLPLAAADADSSHGTLARSYAQYTQRVNLEDCSSADEIMNRAMADERRVIVDLPAQSLRHLQNWFEGAAIMRFAREQRVTQIFVGHSAPDRWKEMWSRSPVDRLIQAARDIDVRIFPHPQTP